MLLILILYFFSGVCVNGQNEYGEIVFQEALRWNYTYMNPNCTTSDGLNPCTDIRICTFAVASLAMGGWPTLCGWVGKGVPKVCCGLPLVLGPGLMKKVDEELSRKRECGTTSYSAKSEITKRLFAIKNALPEVDTSDPNKFDPPLDLEVKPMLIPPAVDHGSRQGLFPWMISIRQNGSHLCGGSLIDRKHILTAASCVLDNKNEYTVHIGNLYVDDGYVIHVKKTTIHPDHEQHKSFKSLAVITLSEEILSPKVAHICLLGPDSVDANMKGMNTTLLQWGEKLEDDERRQYLNVIDGLIIVPIEKCLKNFEKCIDDAVPKLKENFICVEPSNQSGTKFGVDIGGPLMHRNNFVHDPKNPWTLIAVDTFDPDCGNSRFPRLLAKVSNHMGWITEIMKE